MMRIAITGGIACGKSLAGSLLAQAGWAVCEADTLAHGLYAPDGPAYDAVCRLAGADVVGADGRIDRATLAQKAFADPARLQALNAILHPLVKQAIGCWLEACARQDYVGAAAIVPLLFEAGMADGWDAVVGIGCRAEVQRKRLMARGLEEEDIKMRLAAQWPLERKMAAADYGIWNDGSRAELQQALNDVISRVSERKRK